MKIYFGKILPIFLYCIHFQQNLNHFLFFFRLSPSQQVSTSDRAESTSLSLSQTNLLACGPSNRIEPSSSSWSCGLCTYVNSIKSSRCVQCSTRRDATSPEHQQQHHHYYHNQQSGDASLVQDQLNALTIRESCDSEANALNRASSLCMSGSRTNLAASGTRNSPCEQQKTYSNQCKWCCTFCTYENWPKSIRCAMCGSSKDYINNETERIGANTISSPERDFDENCAGNFIIANANNKRNTSHHRYALNASETINSCDSIQDRRLRQIRRQADWQWLNACIGKISKNYFLLIL